MEKKVNLTIFFNYRHYSPRFKLLLEDVFYKKMHDEKLSSSDAMQQVMRFCNDVDEIEYMELELQVLSRYLVDERKIIINSLAMEKLQEDHKDLDEEALLKSILQKQVQNVIYKDETSKISDVTFDDILNRNGYVAPIRLSQISENEKKNDKESMIDDIVSPKYNRKNEEITITENDRRFVDNSKTLQIGNLQNDLKQKLESLKNQPIDDIPLIRK